jgi:hypothetical protein
MRSLDSSTVGGAPEGTVTFGGAVPKVPAAVGVAMVASGTVVAVVVGAAVVEEPVGDPVGVELGVELPQAAVATITVAVTTSAEIRVPRMTPGPFLASPAKLPATTPAAGDATHIHGATAGPWRHPERKNTV